jgi:hypothetical protein
METLRSHYESRKKRGEAPSDVVAATEFEWRDAVRSSHGSPFWIAASLVLGTAGTAAGIYLLLADSGVFPSRQEQTTWGLVLVGASLPTLAGGIYSLLPSTSAPETWWNVYKELEPRVSIGVVPMAHGGATGVVRFGF